MTDTAVQNTEVTQPESAPVPAPTTFEQNYQRLMLVKKYYADGIFVEGEDYGVIPGKSPKPSLFKPGAEKLCVLFGLAPCVEVIERVEDWPSNFVSYEVRVTLRDIETKAVRAQGVGHCNSRERKYKSQQAADVANTCLKMAKKRGFIDGVLSATGASAIFTQDVEDMVEPPAPAQQRAPTQQRPPQQYNQPPQRPQNAPPQNQARQPAQPPSRAPASHNGQSRPAQQVPPSQQPAPAPAQPVVLATDAQRNSYEDDRAFAIWLGVTPEPPEMPQRIKTETAGNWKIGLERKIKKRLEERGLSEEEAFDLLRAEQEAEDQAATELSSSEPVSTDGATS